MIFFQVPVTWQVLNFPLVLLCLYTVAFGAGTILLHFGVFVEDLSNITNILFRLLFYFSGIFYAISTRIPKPFSTIMLICNPVAFCINQFRKIFINGVAPNYIGLLLWFLMGCALTAIGVKLIHKYESSYAKVV